MPRLPSQKQLVLLLISGVLLLVMTFLSDATPSGEQSIFGALSVKERDSKKRQRSSNYDRAKDTKTAQSELRYKVRRRKENPFFSLYRAEQATAVDPENPAKSTPKRKKRRRYFYDLISSDALDKSLFDALLEVPRLVNERNSLGWGAVHAAARVGGLSLLRKLSHKEASMNAGTRQAIRLTVSCGVERHRMLLRNAVTRGGELRGVVGWTALHEATTGEHRACADFLRRLDERWPAAREISYVHGGTVRRISSIKMQQQRLLLA